MKSTTPSMALLTAAFSFIFVLIGAGARQIYTQYSRTESDITQLEEEAEEEEEFVLYEKSIKAQDGDIVVTAKGFIPDNYYLSLVKKDTKSESGKKDSFLFSKDDEILGSYDISIVNEKGKEFQPADTGRPVTLYVESEKFKNCKSIEVCHVPDKGLAEMMDVMRVRDDAVVVVANSFSVYVFTGTGHDGCVQKGKSSRPANEEIR